jgi:hypothetical protein
VESGASSSTGVTWLNPTGGEGLTPGGNILAQWSGLLTYPPAQAEFPGVQIPHWTLPRLRSALRPRVDKPRTPPSRTTMTGPPKRSCEIAFLLHTGRTEMELTQKLPARYACCRGHVPENVTWRERSRDYFPSIQRADCCCSAWRFVDPTSSTRPACILTGLASSMLTDGTASASAGVISGSNGK